MKAAVVDDDPNKLTIVGADSIDWYAVISTMKETGGTQWYVVEQEEYPNQSLEIDG